MDLRRSAELAEIGRQRLDLGLTEIELRHTGVRLVRARVPQSSLDLLTAEASADQVEAVALSAPVTTSRCAGWLKSFLRRTRLVGPGHSCL
jgi:hypothetical protein